MSLLARLFESRAERELRELKERLGETSREYEHAGTIGRVGVVYRYWRWRCGCKARKHPFGKTLDYYACCAHYGNKV